MGKRRILRRKYENQTILPHPLSLPPFFLLFVLLFLQVGHKDEKKRMETNTTNLGQFL
jgi:hypothetical protein